MIQVISEKQMGKEEGEKDEGRDTDGDGALQRMSARALQRSSA